MKRAWGVVLFLALCGCGLTLGPVVKTEYVMVHPGKPLEILENAKVTGRVLDNTAVDPVQQEVGGWVVMPPEHWNAVKRRLETTTVAPK